MLKNITAKIISNKEIAACIYELVLYCPDADLEHFVPGQFAHIEIPGRNDLLLKRPISINKLDTEEKTVTLVYQLVGKGTNALIGAAPGTEIKAILPIGKGFILNSDHKKVFLVGGGVGIAPLLTVTKRWPDKEYEAYLGYRGIDYAYCIDDFKCECRKVFITSNDGTVGKKGFVTEKLKERLKAFKPDIVLTCGPIPMLKAIKSVIGDIPAQASMEQRMGCGFGACAVCVCGIKDKNGLDYKKACIEGPVFDFAELEL